MTLFVGIDPGLFGAVAALREDGSLEGIWDTPTLCVIGGKKVKRHFYIGVMAEILRKLCPCRAALENVHSMPKQGVTSSFCFGRGLGTWEGILAALQIPVHMVAPYKWKQATMEGMGWQKDASRVRGLQLFPDAPLQLKKHHGRGDALLMAYWLWKTERVVSVGIPEASQLPAAQVPPPEA